MVGLMVTGVAVVTVPTPLLMTPVPLLKTAVRVVLVPAVRGALATAKLVITGAGGGGVDEDPPPQAAWRVSTRKLRSPSRNARGDS